jgi:hypothetical protein
VEETLKNLLKTELEAEKRVAEAAARKEEITREALAEARQIEADFAASIPAIHAAFQKMARVRASQRIAERRRDYAAYQETLCRAAQDHRQEAIEAALTLLLDIKGE